MNFEQQINENLRGQKVRVIKETDNNRTTIHEGVVIGQTSSFVKVYKPRPPKFKNDFAMGDLNQESAESFPINGKIIRVEKIQTKKE